MKWRNQLRVRERGLFIFSVIAVCLVCSGCGGRGEKGQNTTENQTETETGATVGNETEQESGADVSENRPLPPIPKTKEEEEELFGRTIVSGQWIPPKGSYRASDGNIYNKEGIAIGSWRKPTEEEIENAAG